MNRLIETNEGSTSPKSYPSNESQNTVINIPNDIAEIAAIIDKDWTNVYFGARPYLDAMYALHTNKDNFGADSSHSIVLYFLSNANTWKGETARAVKKKLKNLIR